MSKPVSFETKMKLACFIQVAKRCNLSPGKILLMLSTEFTREEVSAASELESSGEIDNLLSA